MCPLIKTKKRSINNGKTLICSMDLGKATHAVYYRLPDGSDIKPVFIENSFIGFNKFWQMICSVKKKYQLEEVVLGFESTSCYWEPIIYMFAGKDIKLVQVNPMHTKRFKEVTDNSPTKSDLKDPLVIADIMELGKYLEVCIPTGVEADIRRFIEFRTRINKDRTALLNRLEKLVHRVFPEFLQIMKGLKTKTAQHLIKHYPLPQQLLKLGYKRLAKLILKISRKRIKEERAKMLIEAAKRTIGIREGLESITLHMQVILEDFERADKRLEQIDRRLEELLQAVPYSQYILSIKGIGLVNGATIIGEIAQFDKYSNSRQLEKLAGLNLCENSSGKRKGSHRISRRGRPKLRTALFFATLNAIRSEPMFKEYYQSCRERGMVKMKALIATSRKLIRTIYALVKNQTMFDPEYKN